MEKVSAVECGSYNAEELNLAVIFASTNAAAIDIIAAEMIGYEAGELPILIQARKRGMIESFEDIPSPMNVLIRVIRRIMNI
jgi:uncharacterized protein (DUF362 family)